MLVLELNKAVCHYIYIYDRGMDMNNEEIVAVLKDGRSLIVEGKEKINYLSTAIPMTKSGDAAIEAIEDYVIHGIGDVEKVCKKINKAMNNMV